MELCEFVSRNPLRAKHLTAGKPEEVIRHALRRYTDEVGRLWICLADFYLRQGLFGRARDVFEEAISSVATARDFGIIFNAYMKFEEQMIEAEIEEDADVEVDDDEEEEDDEDQINQLLEFTFRDIAQKKEEIQEEVEASESRKARKKNKDSEEDTKFFRLENLIQRRPFLLSNLVLR